jgi:hypothetical protein
MFNNHKEKTKTPDDNLCCPITFEIMKNPVFLPSGHSYEREIIEKMIVNGVVIDPITREEFKDLKKPLPTNFALKNLIEIWLKQHPDYTPQWAQAKNIETTSPRRNMPSF